MQLTQTETWWVEECAKAEALMVKKCQMIQQVAQDPQLQQICRNLEQTHRRHIDTIASVTRRPGF